MTFDKIRTVLSHRHLKCVILAGGRGRRLEPLTDLVPKPLLPIRGWPILGTLLKSVRAAGITEVAIVTGHLASQIHKFVAEEDWGGLQISFFHQSEPKGSGDAVLQAQDFLDSPFLVAAGDTAFGEEHVRGLVNFHHTENADVSLCLKRLPPSRLAMTSSVELAEGNRIAMFVEKPQLGSAPSELSAALLHIYPPSLKDYLRNCPLSSRGENELTAVLNPMIADGLLVMGREFSVPDDLTTAEDFLRLNFPYLAELRSAKD